MSQDGVLLGLFIQSAQSQPMAYAKLHIIAARSAPGRYVLGMYLSFYEFLTLLRIDPRRSKFEFCSTVLAYSVRPITVKKS